MNDSTTLDQDVSEITRSIWEMMLGFEVTDSAPQATGADDLTSWVEISGAWDGAVTLHCPPDLARAAAAAMFAMDADEPGIDEIHDTLRELANMIGGNVKALLPEPSNLSLPSVGGGTDAPPARDGTRTVTTIGFDCQGRVFRVSVLEHRPGPSQ